MTTTTTAADVFITGEVLWSTRRAFGEDKAGLVADAIVRDCQDWFEFTITPTGAFLSDVTDIGAQFVALVPRVSAAPGKALFFTDLGVDFVVDTYVGVEDFR